MKHGVMRTLVASWHIYGSAAAAGTHHIVITISDVSRNAALSAGRT